jgi:hypothetical protein
MEKKQEIKKEDKKGYFKVFTFGKEYTAPEYKYNATHGFIEWGKDNQYPQYLLDLYNHYGSATHKSIINKKTRLTTGYGLKNVLDTRLKEYIRKNKLEDVLKKCEVDFEIFNGFCFEVIWNNEGSEFNIHYVPFNRIRRGIENEEIDYPHFWYSKNWREYKKDEYEPQLFRRFDPNVKTGKQLYYYIEPNPQQDEIYPIPNYSTSINWIELDYEISKFHLNQVKQGFAPSFILNFATGIPSIEEMDDYYRDFKRNYEGAENSGKIIITYSEGIEQKPELTPIQLNDSDERFIMLQDMVEKNIVMGHEIPPQLVILTPGKLGSTTERQELLTEFQQYYITTRQVQIENTFNYVLSTIGFTEEIILNQYDDITTDKVEDLGVQEKAQAELKGSVGGVQGILSIQQSVSQGFTTIDAGAAILELIYGISPIEARRMLGEPKPAEPADNTQQIING